MNSISIVSIQRFAGEDYTRAQYYDFDSDHLLEMEPHVRHYNLYTAFTPDRSRYQPCPHQRILHAEREKNFHSCSQ